MSCKEVSRKSQKLFPLVKMADYYPYTLITCYYKNMRGKSHQSHHMAPIHKPCSILYLSSHEGYRSLRSLPITCGTSHKKFIQDYAKYTYFQQPLTKINSNKRKVRESYEVYLSHIAQVEQIFQDYTCIHISNNP